MMSDCPQQERLFAASVSGDAHALRGLLAMEDTSRLDVNKPDEDGTTADVLCVKERLSLGQPFQMFFPPENN